MQRSDKSVKAPVFAVDRLRMGTDGPGVTTLVGFMGCPLKCKYCLNGKCHEPIYESDGKTVRKGIIMLTPQALYEKVRLDNIYFQSTGGGICFGGGEPTLYPSFIEEFRKLCGDKWKITLETSLKCSEDTIERLCDIVDYWIVDVKSLNPDIYQAYTEKNSEIEQRLRLLGRRVPHKESVAVKVPSIPGFNEEDDLDAAIEHIKDSFGFTDVSKTNYIIK